MRPSTVMLLVACGRVGFGPQDGTSIDSNTSTIDALATDALTVDAFLTCVDDDGTCPPNCLGMDSDCQTTCGDGICVGNAGEKCGSCPADCNTAQPVCGNGRCEGDETSVSCMTDCGPEVWPLAAEELALLDEINNLRAGFTCPGDMSATVSGPLAMGSDPSLGARRLAWHIAHQPDSVADNMMCNGTTYLSLVNQAGYSGGAMGTVATVQGVMTNIMTSGSVCRRVMMGSYSEISIGLASDVGPGWVVFLR